VTLSTDLSNISHSEKDALMQTLSEQLAAAQERIPTQDAGIAALEARLDALIRPSKTPDNSSKPPSQGRKQDRPPANRPPRKSPPMIVQRVPTTAAFVVQHSPDVEYCVQARGAGRRSCVWA
jgi:hypothetical protein